MSNVPNVPGVPPLSSYAANTVSLLVGDVVAALLGLGAPQWGLFKNGAPVIAADTVVSFDYRQNWTIADYPIEGGKFESYDKVATPFEVKLRFAAGGSEGARQALLDSVAAIAGTLTLFDGVTPEAIYQNVNIQHYDYRRTATNGVGMIVIDLWCVEVRVTSAASFSSTGASFSERFGFPDATKTASGASPVSGGQVQATPIPAASGPLKVTVNPATIQ